jgi:hypothetical protein
VFGLPSNPITSSPDAKNDNLPVVQAPDPEVASEQRLDLPNQPVSVRSG